MSILRPCFVALLVLSLAAQAATKTKIPLPLPYKQWLERDVVYIITDEERKAFLQLSADTERDRFMEEFWEVRNPVRGAKQNIFKEEHYRRLQYADETFGRHSNTPGWMTDMGRTYVEFGKPVSKANFTGYGQIYPLELWFYENRAGDPSLPPFFYVLFFIPEDIGEYRFYHPVIDGPLKLVRGTQFRGNRDVYKFLQPLGGDIAHAVFSLIPNDPLDTQNYTVNMSGEMLISKIQNLANDSFHVKKIRELRSQRASVTSFVLVNQEDALDLNYMVLTDPQGQTWLDYTVWIKDEKFGRADPNGRDLVVTAGFRLTTDTGDLIVDDSEERVYPAFESAAAEKKFTPFRVANRIPVVPGKYTLHVQVISRQAGKIFESQRKIVVSPIREAALSGPLLAATVRQIAQPDGATPFQYYGIQFIPIVERKFPRGEPLRALFQIQLPGAASGNYLMEYVIAHTQLREQRLVVKETLPADEFQNGRLLKAKTIKISDLAEGDYRAVLTLRTEAGNTVLAASNIPFRIADEPANDRLYFLSNFRIAAKGGVAAYVRALESVAQQDREKASEYLAQAIDQNQSNSYAGQMLVGLYFNSRQYARVTALYERMGLGAFRSAPESLAQISVSFWQAGNAAQARQVIQTARTLFPQDPLLDATERSFRHAQSH